MRFLIPAVVLAAVALFVAWPYVYFRYVYEEQKRLREVEPGRFYRSGQLTASGFADAVRKYGIRTIINVQDEFPDPTIDVGFGTSRTVKETKLCQDLGVRYVHLMPDVLHPTEAGLRPPAVVEQFLAEMDREDAYPVLIHCKAGLHRTGVLCAVYRMEYQRWPNSTAYRELKALGFGNTACSAANPYVSQYVLTYRPRHTAAAEVASRP